MEAIKEVLGFAAFLAAAVLTGIVAALVCSDVFKRPRARRRLVPTLAVCVAASAVNVFYLALLVITRVPQWRQLVTPAEPLLVTAFALSPVVAAVQSVDRLLPAIAGTIEIHLGMSVAAVIVDSDRARHLAAAHDGACLVDGLDDDAFYQVLAAKNADALIIVGEADAGCGVIALGQRGALQTSDLGLLRAMGREATRVYRRLQLEESRRVAALAEETALRLAAEVKLASLRAQINPHFLFNTLNAIAALIETDPVEAERLIEDLSDILRRLVSDGREVVPLEEELELVDAYVKIEQARLGYPLSYQKRLEPSTAGRLVPTLSIQPLVENAVRHGAIPKQAPCLISVSAELRDNTLCISVRDDGLGHSGAIRRRTGLGNVAGRLTALYGPVHVVKFDSQPGAGATVSFSVPAADKKLAS